MQTSMIQVHEYFKCHLQRRNWQSLDSETQSAAVKTAENDIMLALGTDSLDTSDLLIFCAVCEQALYLSMNSDTAGSGKIKSETIEGIGKREYFEDHSRHTLNNGILSPRSELFLSRLPGVNESRFSRG